MENNKKINWFIGHMKKTLDIFETQKKSIDFIIEILDSRLPTISSNNEILSRFPNKEIIKICTKSNFVENSNKKNKSQFYCDIKNPSDRSKTIAYIEKKLSDKKEKMVKKGLVNPIFVGMVVGLPNIGKSSFINFLANKKQLNVENRPGVTRKIENIKLNNSLYLIDTPGVFIKNVENYQDGLKLALINCVDRKVVDKKDLASILFEILIQQNKIGEIQKIYNISNISSFNNLIIQIANNRNVDIGNETALDNLYQIFVKETLDDGKIKIFLE